MLGQIKGAAVVLAVAGLGVAATAAPAAAQSADWNGNYQFRSAGERLVDLRRAALIERVESGRLRDSRALAVQVAILGGVVTLGSNDDFYGSLGGLGDGSGDYWSAWTGAPIVVLPAGN